MPTQQEIDDAIARYVQRCADFAMLAAGAGVDPDEIRRRVEAGIAEGRKTYELKVSYERDFGSAAA